MTSSRHASDLPEFLGSVAVESHSGSVILRISRKDEVDEQCDRQTYEDPRSE